MYCHYCSRQFAEDDNFCSKCGRPLKQENDEIAASAEPYSLTHVTLLPGQPQLDQTQLDQILLEQMQPEQMDTQKTSRGSWLLPSALLLFAMITAGSLFALYQYENRINTHVLELQLQAKNEAHAGNYETALRLLEEASSARPNFAALGEDMRIIQHVDECRAVIARIDDLLSQGLLTEAENEFGQLKAILKDRSELIYTDVKDEAARLNNSFSLLKLGEKLKKDDSFQQLANTYQSVNGLYGSEAEALSSQVAARIVEVTEMEAEALVNKRNFKGALSVIDRSLTVVKENEALLDLQHHIQDKKLAFELNEQQRLERAMQSAAQEDLINQTAAVEVVDIETMMDEFGDLHIEATLKNVATRPIYSVSVQYKVASEDGAIVREGYAEASPNYIEPGELMTFTATEYGVFNDEMIVTVEHSTWYLD